MKIHSIDKSPDRIPASRQEFRRTNWIRCQAEGLTPGKEIHKSRRSMKMYKRLNIDRRSDIELLSTTRKVWVRIQEQRLARKSWKLEEELRFPTKKWLWQWTFWLSNYPNTVHWNPPKTPSVSVTFSWCSVQSFSTQVSTVSKWFWICWRRILRSLKVLDKV